jgi:hypothetical protein
MLDSIRMIEKLIIGEALDAQSASVLRVIRVARDLCDSAVFLMNHDPTPRHATLTNRPDDLFFHVFPPGFNELWSSSYSFSSGFSIQLETLPFPSFYFSSNRLWANPIPPNDCLWVLRKSIFFPSLTEELSLPLFRNCHDVDFLIY